MARGRRPPPQRRSSSPPTAGRQANGPPGRGGPPSNGPLGATLPAMVDAMALALETKGTMHLAEVMQPAIELADGFPMYEFLRHYLISERKATEQYEWSAKPYYPDGRIPDVGEMFRQPNLAKTIRTLA